MPSNSAQPDNEPSQFDLVSHRGSSLYRERIGKEERGLRTEYMGKEVVKEIDTYSGAWLAESPAEFWSMRKKEARAAAGSVSSNVVLPKDSARARALKPSHPSRILAPEERMPVTCKEHAEFAARRRMERGPSTYEKLSFEVSQLMRELKPGDSTESIGNGFFPGEWPHKPRSIDGMPSSEVQARAKKDLHKCVAQMRGMGGTLLNAPKPCP